MKASEPQKSTHLLDSTTQCKCEKSDFTEKLQKLPVTEDNSIPPKLWYVCGEPIQVQCFTSNLNDPYKRPCSGRNQLYSSGTITNWWLGQLGFRKKAVLHLFLLGNVHLTKQWQKLIQKPIILIVLYTPMRNFMRPEDVCGWRAHLQKIASRLTRHSRELECHGQCIQNSFVIQRDRLHRKRSRRRAVRKKCLQEKLSQIVVGKSCSQRTLVLELWKQWGALTFLQAFYHSLPAGSHSLLDRLGLVAIQYQQFRFWQKFTSTRRLLAIMFRNAIWWPNNKTVKFLPWLLLDASCIHSSKSKTYCQKSFFETNRANQCLDDERRSTHNWQPERRIGSLLKPVKTEQDCNPQFKVRWKFWLLLFLLDYGEHSSHLKTLHGGIRKRKTVWRSASSSKWRTFCTKQA